MKDCDTTDMDFINVAELDNNTGQIPGVPANTRKISKGDMQKLILSLQTDWDYMHMRPLIVYKYNGRYVVIGGNQRLAAIRKMNGRSKVPCKIIPDTTPTEKIKKYLLLDNANFGRWTPATLDGYDAATLAALNVNFTKAWGRYENFTDLKQKVKILKIGDLFFVSIFEKTKEGINFNEIKKDNRYVDFFAGIFMEIVKMIIGLNCTEEWAVVTTPRRRNREFHFATEVCRVFSQKTGVNFYPDAFESTNRTRINPIFSLEKKITENNVIVFDDIITTGSTVLTVNDILKKQNKNIINIIGINNRKHLNKK